MIDPNFVKLGDEYFAPEWFDYDREENDMDFDPDTQPEKRFFPADEPDDDFEDEEYLACPQCGNDDAFDYIGEGYDDEQHLGSCYKCGECGHEFTMNDD